ncbi:MAG: hypothetical protein JKY03_04330 [Aureispira sp.]|nr:hypothetical protein [Aureispira sp.]
MKNKILFLILIPLIICSCATKITPETTTDQKPKEEPKEAGRLGGDKDEHGCLVTAGATWSKLKQECIRVFSVGIRLNPILIKEETVVFSAFVVFNDDKSKLELYLRHRGVPGSTILPRLKNGKYKSGEYEYDRNNSTLSIDGEAMYKADKKTATESESIIKPENNKRRY